MAKKLDLKEGKLTMFKRDNENPNAPDYGGQVLISEEVVDLINSGERQFDIAVYMNTSKAGNPYISGEIKPMWVNPNEPSKKELETEHLGNPDEEDDDLPF